jgi:hydroxymethylglutaryl-CoA reductase
MARAVAKIINIAFERYIKFLKNKQKSSMKDVMKISGNGGGNRWNPTHSCRHDY